MLRELPYFGSNKFELRRCWLSDARAALFTISFKGNWPALASRRRTKLLVKLASRCMPLNGKERKKTIILKELSRPLKHLRCNREQVDI